MAPTDMALTVRCPSCKAWKHNPCVYMSDKPPKSRWDRVNRRYVTVSPGEDRIGLPLKDGGVHSERRAKARQAMARDRFKAEVAKISPTLLAIRRFDLAEYVEMQRWLRRWGPLLWSKPQAVVLCPDCGRAACDGNCEYERLQDADH